MYVPIYHGLDSHAHLTSLTCRYDLKQGTHPFPGNSSNLGRLIYAPSFSVLYRNFQEPGVEGAYRARKTRGRTAQGVQRDEEEERCRGPGLIVAKTSSVGQVGFMCGWCVFVIDAPESAPVQGRLGQTCIVLLEHFIARLMDEAPIRTLEPQPIPISLLVLCRCASMRNNSSLSGNSSIDE